MSTTLMTLCVVYNNERILLGLKKIGFGAGFWNGFGGKVEQGEPIEDAARRELLEEVGIQCDNMDYRALLRFAVEGEDDIKEVHIFHVGAFRGDPKESDEMKPAWFLLKGIPFDMMWPDDRYWLPMFLNGKKLSGHFLFRRKGDAKEIVSYTLNEVDTL